MAETCLGCRCPTCLMKWVFSAFVVLWSLRAIEGPDSADLWPNDVFTKITRRRVAKWRLFNPIAVRPRDWRPRISVDNAMSQTTGEPSGVSVQHPGRLPAKQAMKPAFAAGAALTLAMLPGCHRPPARASEADGLTPVPAARYIVGGPQAAAALCRPQSIRCRSS